MIHFIEVWVKGLIVKSRLNNKRDYSDADLLKSLIDALLREHMPDGGFNCRSNRSGAIHSSMHSTLSVLEGLSEYEYNGYQYRTKEVKKAIRSSKEFILMHRLYLSV